MIARNLYKIRLNTGDDESHVYYVETSDEDYHRALLACHDLQCGAFGTEGTAADFDVYVEVKLLRSQDVLYNDEHHWYKFRMVGKPHYLCLARELPSPLEGIRKLDVVEPHTRALHKLDRCTANFDLIKKVQEVIPPCCDSDLRPTFEKINSLVSGSANVRAIVVALFDMVSHPYRV